MRDVQRIAPRNAVGVMAAHELLAGLTVAIEHFQRRFISSLERAHDVLFTLSVHHGDFGLLVDMAVPPMMDALPVGRFDSCLLTVGALELEVWHTPGHTNSQLAFRCGDVLLSGDNIYRDGCVGAIDAHHGSDIKAFIRSLERIRDSDVRWLAPSHGPIFAKDNAMLQKTIDRLSSYLHMADFGTCMKDWPLMDEFERELEQGILPEGVAESQSQS